MTRQSDQAGDEPQQERCTLAWLLVPLLGEIEKCRKQEERVRMTIRAVERGVVVQVRSQQYDRERRRSDALAEMPAEHSAQNHQPCNSPEQS